MSNQPVPPRIGIFGVDPYESQKSRGCCLWSAGYGASVTAAGGTPVSLEAPRKDQSWDDLLEDLDGVVLLGTPESHTRLPAEERLCEYCYENAMPLSAVDQGMLALNQTFGGTVFVDLPREQPNSLQHRHPPEKGLRHAINIEPNTKTADIYGEGEIVVNSEHRRAVDRVARGFRVGARALDGIVEAIESESERWFAMGVQWQPASTSASGLDIQVFRALVNACQQRVPETVETPISAAA